MKLTELEVDTLQNDLSEHIKKVITDDEFLKVKTKEGNAVIISEAEWNILVQAMGITLHNA